MGDLRLAVQRRDGAAGIDLLAGRPIEPVLQYAGDVVVSALSQGLEDAESYALKCLEELDARNHAGDAELARQLSVALGRLGEVLDEVPIDLGELGVELDGDGDAYVVDLKRGEVLHIGVLNGEETGVVEPAFDEGSEAYDPGRWLVFWPQSGQELQDMADFADLTGNERLSRALDGRGAVWRFFEAVKGTPDDQRWLVFREDRQRGRARAWLAERGYRPA